MVDQNNGDGAEPQDDNPFAVPLPSNEKVIVHPPPNAPRPEQIGTPDNPMHIRDRDLDAWTASLVRWTRAITFVAAVTAVIAFLQWCVIERTDEAIHNVATAAGRADDQYFITNRASVAAKEIRVERKTEETGGSGDYWSFTPVLENGGKTPTMDMRVVSGLAYDPGRTDIKLRYPFILPIGPRQFTELGHVPEKGPPDPEAKFYPSDGPRVGNAARLVRVFLGIGAAQPIGESSIFISDLKQRLEDGARWFVLGAIHYTDRFPSSPMRVTKFCYAIGFTAATQGDPKPTVISCPHWNCADDECKEDKAEYDAETADFKQAPFTELAPSQSAVLAGPRANIFELIWPMYESTAR